MQNVIAVTPVRVVATVIIVISAPKLYSKESATKEIVLIAITAPTVPTVQIVNTAVNVTSANFAETVKYAAVV